MEFCNVSMELPLPHAECDFLLANVGVHRSYADDCFSMDLLDLCIPLTGTNSNDICVLPVCNDCQRCDDFDMPENVSGYYAFAHYSVPILLQQVATKETNAHFEAAKVEKRM